MPLFIQISISMILGLAGLAILILGARWLRAGSVSKRLVQYVAAPLDNTRSQVNVSLMQTRLITGSFFTRTLIPAIRGIGRFFGRLTPSGAIESLARKLQ